MTYSSSPARRRGRINYNLELDADLHGRALVVAGEEDRTLANLIRRALRIYIDTAEANLLPPLRPEQERIVYADTFTLPVSAPDRRWGG